MPDVQLLLNGSAYGGWKEVSVRRSLDIFADTFDLTLTDTEAGQARGIRLGSPCQVRIDGETLITGYVDRIRPGHDARSRRLTVSGRSKTADLVDCSLPPHKLDGVQKREQTLLELSKYVCGLVGIESRSLVSGLTKRRVSVIENTETLFEFLESHSRADAVMLVSGSDGSLVITRASGERVGTALVLGENIEEADGEFSERDRFSHYYVSTQQPNWNDDQPEMAAHITGESSDVHVRYRPTTVPIDSMDAAQAKRRAEWQRNVNYGRSRQATYTVTGWRHSDGLWAPNTLVRVIDAWMGFEDEWLMIGTAEFVLDARGRRTRLTVMPVEAYDLVPLPAEDDDGGVW